MTMRGVCAVLLLGVVLACGDSETSGVSSTTGGAGGTAGEGGEGATGGDGGQGNDTGSGGQGNGPPVDCTDLPDFRRCLVQTTPDRFYDICASGSCVSPGCGTADCNAPGPHVPLADTGQRLCYDAAGAVIPCGALGACTTLCGQDAQVGWDPGHVASTRFTVAADNAALEATTTDTVTGLMWTPCAAGTSDDCAGTPDDMLWADALVYCEELSYAGFSDWRLPNEYEAQSIIDYGRDAPAIDDSVFPGTPNERFVTSSTYAGDETGAWFSMWSGGGVVGVVLPKDDAGSTGKVRCVRDPVPPLLQAERFERLLSVSGEPTVIDNVTELQWQGCEPGLTGDDCATGAPTPFDWASSLDYCHNLSWGGHDDWVLPNVKQLRSIIDNRLTSPGLDATAFPNHQSSAGWSSTTSVAAPVEAWVVNIDFGGGIEDEDKSSTLSARCVRFR